MVIEFFGDVDRNIKGEVNAEMPAWFHDIHLADFEEKIARNQRQIKRGEVALESVPIVQQDIARLKERVKEIRASKPMLKGGQKDMIAKQYFALQTAIADSMPTHRDNKKGYVNPRDELKRWKEYHVPVDKDLAKACNVKFEKGKTTGNGADKMYKMMGRLLGENENIEKIRKEGRSESQRSQDEMTKHILENFDGRK